MDAHPTYNELLLENVELRRLLRSLREQLEDERESHRATADEALKPW